MTPPLLFEAVTIDTRETRGFAAEVKFAVDLAVAGRIRRWARAELAPDTHGTGPSGDQYGVTSVYFDTAEFDVLARHGSFGRAKYRVRRYGDSDLVFLERKLRTKHLLAKRRTCVPQTDLPMLANVTPQGPAPASWSGEWFRRRLAARGLQAVCQISYDRTARVVATPYGVARLTIDEGLEAAPAAWPAMLPASGTPIAASLAIVEIKYRVTMPSTFKRLIEEFSLSPATISKYRLAQHALGRQPALRRAVTPQNKEELAYA